MLLQLEASLAGVDASRFGILNCSLALLSVAAELPGSAYGISTSAGRDHLLTNGALDVLELAASPNSDAPALVAASLPLLPGQIPQLLVMVRRKVMLISLEPAAVTLCDSHPLPITLKPADEVCELVSSPGVVAAAGTSDELKACLDQLDPVPDPKVLSVDNETQPLVVAST
ncbi:hypothetical protein Nepgr_012438 [Nepenthes gracilis]|uniref:Uncharacterized protein n=1 Tax=Nepenthes gracilis TaxID=150966 RepID=A0AAD3SG46_NEPGR|nr:hypothetical protein Nepgr_012438 [Nepenthes gracilis]